MPVFYLILVAVAAGDIVWWCWADRRLRGASKPRRLWRILLALFMGSQLCYELYFALAQHSARRLHRWAPRPFLASTFIWHLLALPCALGIVAVITAAGAVRHRRRPLAAPFPLVPSAPQYSRRQVLATAAALATPPMLTALGVARAVPMLDEFRVRSIDLVVPSLPPNLDGLRIAHLSDTHVGRFTGRTVLPRLIDATNRLRADLVLFTGDLIDLSLDDLPRAIDAIARIDPRHGLALIEGNHDLIEDADAFDARVMAAGLPLLVDQSLTFTIRNERVQVLGMRWGVATGDRRRAGAAAWNHSVELMERQREPGAFPILLGHHPHCFDAAAAAGFPLLLSGHTHGGQLMLSKSIGAGPLFFHYWSGVYRKPASQLVVSNGIGNWFPLRINAPAEIISLTLHRSAY